MIQKQIPLRHVATLNPPRDIVRMLPEHTEVSFLPMEAIGFYGKVDLSRIRPISEVLSGYTYFADGDIAFAKVTPCFENGKGAVLSGLVNGHGFGTTELTVVRPNDPQDAGYLKYVLSESSFVGYGSGEMLGSGGLKRIPDAYVLNHKVHWPSKFIRTGIAAFLDHETGKIDDLISEQEQLITLLGEKRQAVISHAVTKGLDPDVEMKNSGIEWLGEVPAHWAVKKLKMTASSSLRNGLGESSDRDDPENPRYIRITDINGSRSLRNDTFRSLPTDIAAGAMLQKNDILLAAVGATFGKSYLHLDDFDACYAGYLVRYAHNDDTDPRFISHWTESSTYWNQLNSNVIQSTVQNFSASKYGELYLAMPPISEQFAISEFLDREVERIQSLQEQAERAMSLLKERRSALISAAVTGKIDVRNHPAAVAALNENKDS